VTADIQADPDPRLAVRDPHVAYGATCIAAAFGPGVSVFTQIGDGDLLAAPAGGDIVKPLPDDEGLEGEQTYSLCHATAVSHFRTKLFSAPHPLATPVFAMASSDGLSKSFAQDFQFLDIARHWRSLVEQNGMEATCADLENWLARCSEMGSGDDNTLMMYCNAAAIAAVPAGVPLPQVAAVALGQPPSAAIAGAKGFGVGALALAAALGAALGAVVLYSVMKNRPSATPPPQAPVSTPLTPLPSGPQPGDAPPHQVDRPSGPPQLGGSEPNKPAQPVELGVPAPPSAHPPRGSKDAPVAAPNAPPLPALPREPGK
jgi:Protein phosphatase 2C